MDYALIGISCLFIGLLIPHLSEIKAKLKRRRLESRYKKLLFGTPKTVIRINDFHHAWENRNYPFYINGISVGIGEGLWWHCNDESKRLYYPDGKLFGYLLRQIKISKRLGENRWEHKWELVISETPNFLGKNVEINAILEVY